MNQRNRNVEDAMRRAVGDRVRRTVVPDWFEMFVGAALIALLADFLLLAGADRMTCNELIILERAALEIGSDKADEYRLEWNHFCGPDRVWYSLKEGRQ